MIHHPITEKTVADKLRLRLKRTRAQPRHQIRKLLRSFEPLPQAKGIAKSDQ